MANLDTFEIAHVYVHEQPSSALLSKVLLTSVSAALDAALGDDETRKHASLDDDAKPVINARQILRLLMESGLAAQAALDQVYDDLRTAPAQVPDHLFKTFLFPVLSPKLLGDALRKTPIKWEAKIQVQNDSGGTFTITKRGTLPGYGGATFTSSQQAELKTLSDLVGGRLEGRFRKNLLLAEAAFRQGLFEQAVVLTREIVDNAGFERERREFAAIRCAAAHIALGDRAFRHRREIVPEERAAIARHYDDAIDVLVIDGIPVLDELLRSVAETQKAKLDAGFNYLGYHDTHVPIIRPEELRRLADTRIAHAIEARDNFVRFQEKVTEIQDQLLQLDFEQDIKTREQDRDTERLEKANELKTIASTRIGQIDTHLDNLKDEALASAAGAGLKLAAAATLSAPVGLPLAVDALGGLIATRANYRSRKDDLRAQREIAESESAIADRDITIATIEQGITNATLDFLRDKVTRIQARELSPDLYVKAAELFRGLAERHLDAAIGWAFAYENAVRFRRLKPDLKIIGFDYADRPAGLLGAAGLLLDDLDSLVEADQPTDKEQLPVDVRLSLASLFPLEFTKFKDTGRMDFSLSLYRATKDRPGVEQERIEHAGVQIHGTVSPAFTGTLIHRGSFLLRDKISTLASATDRFVPDEDRLAGAAQGVAIDGVLPFILDEDTILFTFDTLPLPPPNTPPMSTALRPMEGYGPAADWTLMVDNTDLRGIVDIDLMIRVTFPESDGVLAAKVDQLVADYELELAEGDALDRISAFSLKTDFPDDFLQLPSGLVELNLRREDLPSGISDLKLKTLVAMTVDAEKRPIGGVVIEMSRPDAFLLARTTREDGFTEDIATEFPVLPPEERVAAEGVYRLVLSPSQRTAEVADILLFFMYEFRNL